MSYPSNVMKGKQSERRFSNLNQAHFNLFLQSFASKGTLLGSGGKKKNTILFFSFVLQLEIKPTFLRGQ